MKKPGQVLPLKTSSFSSQAMPSITRISARKGKTPAEIPTTAPLAILPAFSETSALASWISSRTRPETPSVTPKTSSPSLRWGLGSLGGGTAGGVFGPVEDPAVGCEFGGVGESGIGFLPTPVDLHR